MNRIGIANFAIAMVFLCGFVVKRIGSALPTSSTMVAVVAVAAVAAAAMAAMEETSEVEAAAVVPWRFCKSWGDSSFRARLGVV